MGRSSWKPISSIRVCVRQFRWVCRFPEWVPRLKSRRRSKLLAKSSWSWLSSANWRLSLSLGRTWMPKPRLSWIEDLESSSFSTTCFNPIPIEQQVGVLWAMQNNYFDDIDVSKIVEASNSLRTFSPLGKRHCLRRSARKRKSMMI